MLGQFAALSAMMTMGTVPIKVHSFIHSSVVDNHSQYQLSLLFGGDRLRMRVELGGGVCGGGR